MSATSHAVATGCCGVTKGFATVDVDPGLLGKFISEESAKTQLEGRVKGLLA